MGTSLSGVLGVHCASAEAEGERGGWWGCGDERNTSVQEQRRRASTTEHSSAKGERERSCWDGKHVQILSILNDIITCINFDFA